MNTEQITSLIRALLQSVGAVFVTKGIIDDSTLIAIAGGVAALVGVIWGQWSGREKNTLKQAVEGTITMDSAAVTNIVPLPAPTITTKSGDTALMQKPKQ